MAQRILLAVVLVVGLLILAAFGVAVYRVAVGQRVIPHTASTDASEAAPPHPTIPAAPTDNLQEESAPVMSPQAEQAEETVKQYVLAGLPQWETEVVRHDEEWRSATVRARSPDGKVALDIDLIWDKDLGDYTIVAAKVAEAQLTQPGPTQGGRVEVPGEITRAIDNHPRLGKLAGRTIHLKKLTSDDVLLILKSSGHSWRVYLKRKGNHWAIINAKPIEP
jgi:hypothetical protein